MKLSYHPERKRFEAELARGDGWKAEYAAVKAAGFAWDGVNKAWHTDHWKEAGTHSHAKQSGMAARFVQFADAETAAKIDAGALAAVELEKVSLEQSRAIGSETVTGVTLIAPEGLDYLPFQKAGIIYALRIFGEIK